MFHSVLTFLAVYTLVISHYLRMHWVLLLITESKKIIQIPYLLFNKISHRIAIYS